MSYTVKAVLRNGKVGGEREIRRFKVDGSGSPGEFDNLREKIGEMFPSLAEGFQLYWKDDENDFINMSSDEELSEAKKLMQDGNLKVFIKEANKKIAEIENAEDGKKGGGRHVRWGPWIAHAHGLHPGHKVRLISLNGDQDLRMGGWWRHHPRPDKTEAGAPDGAAPCVRKMFRQMMPGWWRNQQQTEGEEAAEERPSREEMRKMRRKWWRKMNNTEISDGEHAEVNPDVTDVTDTDKSGDDVIPDITDITDADKSTEGEQAGEEESAGENPGIWMKMKMKKFGHRFQGHGFQRRGFRRCGFKSQEEDSDADISEEQQNRQEKRKAFRQMMRHQFREMMLEEDGSRKWGNKSSEAAETEISAGEEKVIHERRAHRQQIRQQFKKMMQEQLQKENGDSCPTFHGHCRPKSAFRFQGLGFRRCGFKSQQEESDVDISEEQQKRLEKRKDFRQMMRKQFREMMHELHKEEDSNKSSDTDICGEQQKRREKKKAFRQMMRQHFREMMPQMEENGFRKWDNKSSDASEIETSVGEEKVIHERRTHRQQMRQQFKKMMQEQMQKGEGDGCPAFHGRCKPKSPFTKVTEDGCPAWKGGSHGKHGNHGNPRRQFMRRLLKEIMHEDAHPCLLRSGRCNPDEVPGWKKMQKMKMWRQIMKNQDCWSPWQQKICSSDEEGKENGWKKMMRMKMMKQRFGANGSPWQQMGDSSDEDSNNNGWKKMMNKRMMKHHFGGCGYHQNQMAMRGRIPQKKHQMMKEHRKMAGAAGPWFMHNSEY